MTSMILFPIIITFLNFPLSVQTIGLNTAVIELSGKTEIIFHYIR